MTDRYPVRVVVNGAPRAVDVSTSETLLDALRWDLSLTGSKECCAEGECGACTVLVDGRAVNSCLVLAVEADGLDITTVEGLECGDRLSRAAGRVPGDRRRSSAASASPGMVCRPRRCWRRTRTRASRGGAGGPGRQPVPLRRLPADRRRRAGTAGEAPGATSGRSCGVTERPIGVSAAGSAARSGVTGRRSSSSATYGSTDVLHVRAGHARLRASAHPVDRHREAERVPGVRDVMTAGDLPDPMPRFGPVSRTGRCWRSARRTSTASRWPPSPRRPRRPPRPRPPSSGSPSRSSRRS